MPVVPSPDRRPLAAVALPAVLALSLWMAGCASTPAPDAASVLRQAEQAMGGTGLKTLSFTGSGSGGTFGQAWQPTMGWPGLNYSVLSRQLDFENSAFREEFGRSRSEPNGGGAIPLMGGGEARAVGFARGSFSWNAAGNAAAPAPVALDARIHDLWTSPHGVLKAAARNEASASTRQENGLSYTALSFTEPGRFAATAWVDASGLVSKVESRMPHPVTGDTAVVTTYADYKDFGGVKFPQRIRQSQGGSMVLDIAVKDVKANVAVDIAVPDNVRNFAERVASEKVADGVWFLAGGSHNSVAIEMKDHVVVVETPLYDGRSAAVLAEAKKLVPGKPVRYVINSHHHFDHAGGLRTAVAEGATLVTSAMAKPYFEKVFANPNRISPDLMARSGKAPSIMSVSGKQVLSDGSRTIEIHEMQGSVHAQGFMMVWLPKERLLVQADAYTPGPPNSPPPPAPNANHVNLVQNIDRLGLNVDRLLPLHGRVVPLAELHAAIGRK